MGTEIVEEPRRVSSIARKINFYYVRRLFGKYLGMDILFCIALFVVLLIGLDIQMLGTFDKSSFKLTRMIYYNREMDNYLYQVGNVGDELFFQIQLDIWMLLGSIAGVTIAGIQLLNVIGLAIEGPSKVRRDLNPLNEIAKRARELSRIAFSDSAETSFDEQKYHDLEDAISNLKVDKPDAKINMHDKELVGIENALNDLIDRMRASYKQQTQFVSDASHELRTPIAVIQGYVNMLDRWGKTDESILDESIEAIKNESNHMQKLVEQLLFLARGDSNRQHLDMKTVCLNDIMKEVYEESLMIDEKHVYRFDDKGKAYVYADPDMIKQSARILIDNAAKYTNEKEEIIIRVGTVDSGQFYGSPFYQVQDNGIGMNQTDVEHAFDRFYRADAVRNSKTGGTGLGLSIARWIIDKHDGHVEIMSREGIGTRFSVILKKCDII